jgi:hypothetical protein
MTETVKETKIPKVFKLSGPTKISIKDRSAFSVPAGPKFACPGATKACDGCYAQKKRHLWSPVQKAFAENWKLLRKFERYNQTEQAVQAILQQIRKDAKVFRLYESGDFHSQWVVDVWANVVKSKKDVMFWAYTRSFHLNFAPLTKNKNFALWASTDEFNLQKAKQFVRRFRKSGVKHAYGPWEHDAELPPNSFVCPVTTGQMEVFGACEKCSLCIVKKRVKKNVVFLRH